jgi:peptidyl-dipeptidase A
MMDYTMEALLHEATGHGVDGLQIKKTKPFLLRGHHSVTTESHAMLHENLMQSAAWLEKVVGMPHEEAQSLSQKAIAYNQANLLSGIRGMVRLIQFERQMYKNPDQDLNKLWWDLGEKYLGAKRPPEGDLPTYAAIPHFFSHPVYYQNYFLADLARAQKLAHINKHFGGLLTKEAGDYLATYRKVGDSFDWDDLVERMTGKPLGVDALKQEFSGFELPLPAAMKQSA